VIKRVARNFFHYHFPVAKEVGLGIRTGRFRKVEPGQGMAEKIVQEMCPVLASTNIILESGCGYVLVLPENQISIDDDSRVDSVLALERVGLDESGSKYDGFPRLGVNVANAKSTPDPYALECELKLLCCCTNRAGEWGAKIGEVLR
jgi:hypothetical protein